MSLQRKRQRAPGGGRKRLTEVNKELLADIDRLISKSSPHPEASEISWSPLSSTQINNQLSETGHNLSQRSVCDILLRQGYVLRSAGRNSSDNVMRERSCQFINISNTIDQSALTETHVVLVEFQRQSKEDDGADTEIAAETITLWTNVALLRKIPVEGLFIIVEYRDLSRIKSRIWEKHLQILSNTTGLRIKLSCLPPGTIRWKSRSILVDAAVSVEPDDKGLRCRVIMHRLASPNLKSLSTNSIRHPGSLPAWWNLEVVPELSQK